MAKVMKKKKAAIGRPKSSVKKLRKNYSVKPETHKTIKALARNERAYGEVVDMAVEALINKD